MARTPYIGDGLLDIQSAPVMAQYPSMSPLYDSQSLLSTPSTDSMSHSYFSQATISGMPHMLLSESRRAMTPESRTAHLIPNRPPARQASLSTVSSTSSRQTTSTSIDFFHEQEATSTPLTSPHTRRNLTACHKSQCPVECHQVIRDHGGNSFRMEDWVTIPDTAPVHSRDERCLSNTKPVIQSPPLSCRKQTQWITSASETTALKRRRSTPHHLDKELINLAMVERQPMQPPPLKKRRVSSHDSFKFKSVQGSQRRIESNARKQPVISMQLPRQTTLETARRRISLLVEREIRLRNKDGLPRIVNLKHTPSSTGSETLFGIDPELRTEIISWFLQVLPSKESTTGQELRSHLRGCLDTRFHAASMFCRYMFCVGGSMPIADPHERKYVTMARNRIIWDIALGCLALAVKFHHDFLYPYYPIHSQAFMTVARHKLGCLDFESCQKEVLEALSFEIWGISPFTLLQDLWDAVPSLQVLLEGKTTRWIQVQYEVGLWLNTALLASDMLRFGTTLLTAAALMESLFSGPIFEALKPQDLSRLRTASVTIEQELLVVLQASYDDLRTCRYWMQSVCIDSSDSDTDA